MAYFDVNGKYSFTGDVYKTLDNIVGMYGNNFVLVDNRVKMPAILEHHKKELLDFKYYRLRCNTEYLFSIIPFEVSFYGINKERSLNDCYIDCIHKTAEATGSDIMQMLLKFIKIVGVRICSIADSATLELGNIKIDLSLYKLITTGGTYYEKFGFSPSMSRFHFIEFGDDISAKKILRRLIQQIRLIRISYLTRYFESATKLISSCRRGKKINIIKLGYCNFHKWLSSEIITEELYIFETIYKLLKRTKKHNIQDFMTELYHGNLVGYDELQYFLFHCKIYELNFKEKSIIFPERKLFMYLADYRPNIMLYKKIN